MPITYDAELVRSRERVLEHQRAAKAVLAYVRCVHESGGDWTNLDCMGLTRPVTINFPYPPGASPMEELLGLMPDEEQEAVAASILAAQERLIEHYAGEIAELTGPPVHAAL